MQTLLLATCLFAAVQVVSAQTWTQTMAPSNHWVSIASSADGSSLVAAFANGWIYTSTDSGNTWTKTSAPSNDWTSVASSADGIKLVATAYNGTNCASTNGGTTWQTNSAFGVLGSRYIASSADGSTLLGSEGAGPVFTSTNSGLTWNTYLYDIARVVCPADGSMLVAGNNVGGIYTSTNSGANWVLIGTLGGRAYVFSLAASASGNNLAAIGTPFGEVETDNEVFTSTNSGYTWTSNSLPVNSGWEDVASSADGSKLVVVGQTGLIYTSTDFGTTWVSNNAPQLKWQSVASSADGSKLFAVVNGGGIWTSQTIPATKLYLSITNGLQYSWLSWTWSSTNYVLQQCSDLQSWAYVTNTPVLNISTLQYEVALPMTNACGFYRLATP